MNEHQSKEMFVDTGMAAMTDRSGGAVDLRQFFFRPTWRHYATPAPNIFICSSSTPPGAGVHGMCGHNAGKQAANRL